MPDSWLTRSSTRVIASSTAAGSLGPPASTVCDFVAGVDWSGLDAADEDVVRLLGELEQLTTDVSEGAVPTDAFLDQIGQLAGATFAPPDSGGHI